MPNPDEIAGQIESRLTEFYCISKNIEVLKKINKLDSEKKGSKGMTLSKQEEPSKEMTIPKWHHEIFQDVLVNCCINRRLEEAEVTNTSWWHRPPNHNWLWKLHISLEAAICVPFMFRSPFFLHTLGSLFPKEITNLDSLENMTEDHCSVVFLLSSFFSLHHFSRFCRCLPVVCHWAKVLQLVYGSGNPVHAAFDVLFGQMPPLHHSSLLPHPSQLLGAAKLVLLSQSGQLAVISLRGRPFPATVLPIAAHIS